MPIFIVALSKCNFMATSQKYLLDIPIIMVGVKTDAQLEQIMTDLRRNPNYQEKNGMLFYKV